MQKVTIVFGATKGEWNATGEVRANDTRSVTSVCKLAIPGGIRLDSCVIQNNQHDNGSIVHTQQRWSGNWRTRKGQELLWSRKEGEKEWLGKLMSTDSFGPSSAEARPTQSVERTNHGKAEKIHTTRSHKKIKRKENKDQTQNILNPKEVVKNDSHESPGLTAKSSSMRILRTHTWFRTTGESNGRR